MNKREKLLELLREEGAWDYVPAAFFIHFDKSCHRGQAAIDKHLEFFAATDMDFVKVQYENTFPLRPEIQRPEDWGKMPQYGEEFYADQLHIVDRLVRAAGDRAPVIVTLYSPFMCAGHTVGNPEFDAHLRADRQAAMRGLETITESLLFFVRRCIDLGVDGFYASTQGAESFRFSDPGIFADCIRPCDLAIVEEIADCPCNILHICDYHGGYDDLSPFRDYPGHIVNCSLELGERELSLRQIADYFDRPFMGGIPRQGTIATGSDEAIGRLIAATLSEAPDRYILGADCTLPGEIDWRRIRIAIDAAHRGRS